MTLLEVRDLRKSFGGLMAVADLSFDVHDGEIVGLIGPNGAGKTTAFHLISGHFVPDAGDVRFRGQRIVGLRPSRVSQLGLTRTFQKVQPFLAMTVLENVMVGAFSRTTDASAARRRAEEILELTGMAPVAQQTGENLTLGQWKRLEMAKALATDPKILLLDEVLAGLNPAEIATAVTLVRGIRDRGVAILMVEHIMHAVMELSDRVVVLANGEKIADGAPDDVTRDERVIAAYLGRDYVTGLRR